MSVEIPKLAVVFGSVTPPQGDIIDLRVHLGCTKEVSSFVCLLQNWNKKYSPGGNSPINVGMDSHIDIGRGTNVPTVITCRVESVKYESTPVANYLRVAGRCWGENLFRRVVTKTYENQKGEAIVKNLLDAYALLSHQRNSTELVEDTDTTYTKLDYENTPVWDILKFIAASADKAGVIGYDFRVAPDGKFEFFARNSKTSPVSLSEKIEVSAYRKDIHRVRNKITVYGAPDKSEPSDKDNLTEGILNHLLSDDAEDWHSNTVYHLVGTCIYDPSANQKINVNKVELEAKQWGGTGYYKITYQKEGGSETIIVTDQSFTNETYELKQHTGLDIWSDAGKDITIRFYTRISDAAGTVYSRNHRVVGDIFNGDWSAVSGEISLDSSTKVKGTLSIKTYATSLYYAASILSLKSGEEINCNLYPILNFWIKRESSFNGNVDVILYDSADKSASHFFIIGPDEWFQKQFKVGSENEDIWNAESGFDWTDIKKVRFDCWFTGAGTGGFWIDGLFFGGRRYSSTQEDSSSQSSYGLRELVEVDEELYSDSECQLRAKALLAHLKEPAEYLTVRSTVIDYGNTPILPGDKIHVTLPNENVGADFRILNVEYYVDARTQTLEITLKLGQEQSLLADYLFALRSKTDHLSRYKIARLI